MACKTRLTKTVRLKRSPYKQIETIFALGGHRVNYRSASVAALGNR